MRPVLTVLLALLALWYAACLPMNLREVLTAAERAGVPILPAAAVDRIDAATIPLIVNNISALGGSWSQERPRLPAPHQIAQALWDSTVAEGLFNRKGELSNRNLLYHAGTTLFPTLLGFVIGTFLGMVLAVGIVHSRAMDMSVMPWAIISQTIPIVALAPMIIVVLNAAGIQGLLPKAIISAYLSFFPVVVGMVKGLRSPDAMQLDLLRTYHASPAQGLWKLRLPAAVPYLFASLKIAISAALVGAIVGELPVQQGGLGAWMLAKSYYGQTAQIWAALIVAAVMAGLLVVLIGWVERRTLIRMGVPA